MKIKLKELGSDAVVLGGLQEYAFNYLTTVIDGLPEGTWTLEVDDEEGYVTCIIREQWESTRLLLTITTDGEVRMSVGSSRDEMFFCFAKDGYHLISTIAQCEHTTGNTMIDYFYDLVHDIILMDTFFAEGNYLDALRDYKEDMVDLYWMGDEFESEMAGTWLGKYFDVKKDRKGNHYNV